MNIILAGDRCVVRRMLAGESRNIQDVAYFIKPDDPYPLVTIDITRPVSKRVVPKIHVVGQKDHAGSTDTKSVA